MLLNIHTAALSPMREHAASTTNISTSKTTTSSSSSSVDEATGEEYAVWCPALQLQPAPAAALKALMDGSSASSSSSSSSSSLAVLPASLALDPNAYADPESLALGVLPAKGCMVHVTQVRLLTSALRQRYINVASQHAHSSASMLLCCSGCGMVRYGNTHHITHVVL
jgi:hypothetical protein